MTSKVGSCGRPVSAIWVLFRWSVSTWKAPRWWPSPRKNSALQPRKVFKKLLVDLFLFVFFFDLLKWFSILTLGGDTLYAKLDIWRSAWNQRSTSSSTGAAPVTLPSIQVDDAWNADNANGTQETQQQQQMTTLLSASSSHHLLAVPSPASSFQRGGASPYSDHTHSGSEDFTSEGD